MSASRISITYTPPDQWPDCRFCGKKVNVNSPLELVESHGVVLHASCYERWQTQTYLQGGEGRTYWSIERVDEQIRKIRALPQCIQVFGYRRTSNVLTDTLEVDVLLDAIEPNGQHNPFKSTIHCTAPTPVAPARNALDPNDAVEEFIEDHVLNRQQRRRMLRELRARR